MSQFKQLDPTRDPSEVEQPIEVPHNYEHLEENVLWDNGQRFVVLNAALEDFYTSSSALILHMAYAQRLKGCQLYTRWFGYADDKYGMPKPSEMVMAVPPTTPGQNGQMDLYNWSHRFLRDVKIIRPRSVVFLCVNERNYCGIYEELTYVARDDEYENPESIMQKLTSA